MGPGYVKTDDSGNYAGDPAYYRTIEITKEQYDAIKKFGDDAAAVLNPNYQTYDYKNDNCIDFVFDALMAGGLNPKGYEGNWIPMANAWKINWLLCGQFSINGNGACSTLFTAAEQYVPTCPITFDLDGDGIETVAADANNPILFDYNADGVKVSTGWISADDGLLVMDRNGNGTIDSGKELFGDFTELNAGGTAADGFASLAQEDTNNDGVINNLDANWDRLLKNAHMLCCVSSIGVATYAKNTSHFSGFARLASGPF